MGRKSLKEKRRTDIVKAFGRVLASHGYAGATMQVVALEANLSAGLLHHYFSGKEEMLHELFIDLVGAFRGRISKDPNLSGLGGYLGAALQRGEGSDPQAAKCWVGLFAEAMRDPVLMTKIRRYLEGEISFLCEKSGGKLDVKESSVILAYVLGCLVFGAFAPKKTEGFAFAGAQKILKAMT
jgi:AcrR family transcriptional regulator